MQKYYKQTKKPSKIAQINPICAIFELKNAFKNNKFNSFLQKRKLSLNTQAKRNKPPPP